MSLQATVNVDPTAVVGEVHDHIYGANLEHIGQTIYGGIWAEMLSASKFAEPDPQISKISGRWSYPETTNYGIVMPWTAINPSFGQVYFSHDNTTFYTGQQSQRITVLEDDGRPHGIQQEKLHLEAGRPYQLRLVLRGEGQDVEVQLGDQLWRITAVPDTWTAYKQTLTTDEAESNGVLAITFRGAGNLWIGRASLMPADNIKGFRADLIAALRDWPPTYIRWPGGDFASGYHWRNGVGEQDKRPAYKDPAWSPLNPTVDFWETNDVGTDEFVEFCHLIGSEPSIVLNMGNGTIEEAMAWVEYCNGDKNTTYGRLRAENGHPEPHNVQWWFAGNQMWHEDQIGHSDPETYARRYLEYARAIRSVDPSIKIIGSGMNSDKYDRWNELVLKTAAYEMNGLSVHYYSICTMRWDTPPPPKQLYLPKVAAAHEVSQMLDEVIEGIAEYSDPPVPIALTEWNTYIAGKTPTWHEDYDICDGLYAASIINVCIRRCDRIKNTAVYNLVNVMGNYRVTHSAVWKTPTTLVLEVMTHYRGPLGISCHTDSPVFSSPAMGDQSAYSDVPTIDAAATYDEESQIVYLSLVNRNDKQSAIVNIKGLQRRGETTLYQVAGKHPLSLNTELNPAAVTITESRWLDDTNNLELLPLSFTMAVIPINV